MDKDKNRKSPNLRVVKNNDNCNDCDDKKANKRDKRDRKSSTTHDGEGSEMF
ncbi:MAG: hypothetical protein ACOX1Q_04345 [Eubacteriales bacterium]|jgi:hypothetical protein